MSELPIVVCHRDPDSSNEFHTFDTYSAGVRIFDIDYGYADLSNREEFEEWAEGHLATAAKLLKEGSVNAIRAAAHIAEAVSTARANYEHP